jgi:hypothetical protein
VNEMVDRLVRVLERRHVAGDPRQCARELLEEVRKPTPEIVGAILAGVTALDGEEANEASARMIWDDAIDAALNESK